MLREVEIYSPDGSYRKIFVRFSQGGDFGGRANASAAKSGARLHSAELTGIFKMH